ncbi:glutathione-S-transferase theta, GST, putative [Paecilomyces variotii No. 5]|uniref:Glutathione-S-transferase theta, GST, putative n=1 Tax=Byssochlamys spectabilis (strain No. 5 / NBRC 109023) TaxID=1356009 RepID=V5FA25_BYSSN|nr:glutathione-S-transferase theta, GST, putative [Paecilomyces variotii No. 5]
MSLGNAHSLKLFFSPGACSFAPHVLLLETGLRFELEHSQVGQFTPEFLHLNPKGRVPVLVFDGEVITEMPAILTAISSLVPGDQLLGRTVIESARIYEWLNYLSGTLHGQGYGALWRPERFIDDSNLYPLLQKKAMETIRRCYAFIESKFAAKRSLYAVGNRFTIVDPFLFVLYRWGYRAKIDMECDYHLFGEWANRLSHRKSIVEARKTHVFV